MNRDEKCGGCDYYAPAVKEISQLPIYKCTNASGGGMNSLFVAREKESGKLVVASFLVDLMGEGIKECFSKNLERLDFENMLIHGEKENGIKVEEISLEEAKKIVKAGRRISEKRRNLPLEWKECLKVLGNLDDVEVSSQEIETLMTYDESEQEQGPPEKMKCPCCGREAKLVSRLMTDKEKFDHFMTHKVENDEYTFLGRHFEKEKKPGKAKRLYQRQIALYPDEYEGYLNMGRIFIKKGKYEDAKRYITFALGKANMKKELTGHDKKLVDWMKMILREINEMEEEAEICPHTGKRHWKRKIVLTDPDEEMPESQAEQEESSWKPKENVLEKDGAVNHPIKNCGLPDLSEDFFNQNPLKKMSAQRLLYSKFFYPIVEEKVSKLVTPFLKNQRKKEIKEERERIEKETDPLELLKLMEQDPDPLNHSLLLSKINAFSGFIIPRIIEKLKDNDDDLFAEFGIIAIKNSKENYSTQLIKILPSIKYPYTLSLVCLVLGFIADKEAIQPTWDCFHFFRKEYPQEKFEQGPLLALLEFKERGVA